ncbi:hypothetical protein ACHAXS_002647, partial [Conticribra weissflogii]
DSDHRLGFGIAIETNGTTGIRKEIMSSKLVKKLLQQTCANLGEDQETSHREKIKFSKPSLSTSDAPTLTKEEALQRHVQSILRFDALAIKYSSKTAQNSFTRHSSMMKTKDKIKKQVAKAKSSTGNSRSSCSAFTNLPKEKTFNKKLEKRRREETYFEDVAKMLKKVKKKSKRG